jgi:hypothetical protein
LSNLQYLYLHYNQLSGAIPSSLGNLSNLRALELYNNELCGDIPLSLMNLSNLWSLSIRNNHLTASDLALIEWLNSKAIWATQTPSPSPCQNTETCLVYGIHDDGLNDSQLFTIEPENDFEIKGLGTVHVGHDLEGMDIHPQTKKLYVSSGDDPAKGLEQGYIYEVNKSDGTLIPLCRTGLGEVSAISFYPTDNHLLWVWADGKGLFTIDIGTINDEGFCDKTEIFASNAKVEGIAWDNKGAILYAAERRVLHRYFYETGMTDKVCHHFPSEVEALDMLANGTLLFALHKASDTQIHSFDIDNCSVKDSVPLPVDTPYTDIEGITWLCP